MYTSSREECQNRNSLAGAAVYPAAGTGKRAGGRLEAIETDGELATGERRSSLAGFAREPREIRVAGRERAALHGHRVGADCARDRRGERRGDPEAVHGSA